MGVGAVRDGLRRRRVEMLRKIGAAGAGAGQAAQDGHVAGFQREYERTGRRLEKKPKRPAAAKGWDDFEARVRALELGYPVDETNDERARLVHS